MRLCRATAWLAPALLAWLAPASATEPPVYQQDADGFVAAKGERALAMGYPEALEFWAYPLQLASDYRLRFRVAGQVASIDARPLLRRIERRADAVVRTYVGTDFAVREELFVPRNGAGAIVRYTVRGKPAVQIKASFRPSLDLMWPGSLGGQERRWDAARSGYVLREAVHRFSATIASPEAVAHDDPANRARAADDRLTLLLAPHDGSATLVFALDPAPETDGAALLRAGEAAARADATAHAAQVLDEALAIETPDPAVDRALASAALALDQAWACNDRLGCGVLAGYGPSRPGRRPQYAWFFAGDGMVAMEGMLAAGQYARARDELAFVTRYQDAKSGMLWHELSQSAGLIDWSRYPYMYVHVDITLQYLAAVAQYVAVTGDAGFARANWRALAKAWGYAASLVDRGTGLPRIPPGKQGQNEQEALRDDLRLSSAWIDAAEGYAALGEATGHRDAARAGAAAAARARAAIAADGWDEALGFWRSAHRADGTPLTEQRADAIGIVNQRVFGAAREARALDRFATPDFVADWGLRSVAASDPAYDPNQYSRGSVWALGTAGAATAFWRQHRPLTGWALWRALVAWDTLDSAGHLHEVLAGDLYHPERESVPEQTWSSAGLLTAAVDGLLGLAPRPADRALGFAPHLPPDWPTLTLRNVRVGATRLTLRLARERDALTLAVDNPGAPLAIDFAPQLPLGATAVAADVGGQRAAATLEPHPDDAHARLRFTAASGTTRVRLAWRDGVDVSAEAPPPALGAPSRNPVLAHARLAGDVLTLDGWIADPARAAVTVRSARPLAAAEGATVAPLGDDRWRVTLAPRGPAGVGGYAPAHALLRLNDAAVVD